MIVFEDASYRVEQSADVPGYLIVRLAGDLRRLSALEPQALCRLGPLLAREWTSSKK